MKKININFLFPLCVLLILIFALSHQLFNVSPLGRLLNPFTGAVQNGGDGELNVNAVHNGMGLKDSVKVFFDDRKVPHIYTKNTHDLYFTQGYVTASLRLWQMDFVSYAAAGRLSEIFGDRFLDYDRNQRRMGLLYAAKKTLTELKKDPETAGILAAYAQGVNAYIKQLHTKDIPLEYKLLDYEPEQWSELKSVLVMKNMGATLSGYEEDMIMSNLMVALGEETFNKLYPGFTPHITPVVNDTETASKPFLTHITKPDYLNFSFLANSTIVPESSFNPQLGSNGWVVSGKKTKSGHPILCSDPHLNLSLPAVWLEMQLSSPGLNVYGVSIPGTPAVIIGFNENIAWGTTNGADDVKDWYKLKITSDYKKYELDGKWLNLDYSIEEIKRKSKAPLYDTVYRTVHGPVVIDRSFQGQRRELKNYAMKWELLNTSNEFLTFVKLNRASNYAEYKDAIKNYGCPIQNFMFAGKDNTIATNHQGRLPVKWPGQGRFILDGTVSTHLSTKYIPADSMPHAINPACNFLLSANQHPTAANYNYYYNGYYKEARASRIQQLLENENAFDIGKMEKMQLDNIDAFAVEVMPVLIKIIDKNRLTVSQYNTLKGLKEWNGAFDLNSQNAKLFQLWWQYVKDYTWDEFNEYAFNTKVPDDYVLLDLIQQEPGNIYFDKRATTPKENASDIICKAFTMAVADYDSIQKKTGVNWGDVHKVNVTHLTNIPAFSRMNIPAAGYPDAINATSNNWGPSWRMIVELGDRPKAFGIYAGGQSGNIGSPYYDNFINDWNKGKYYPLRFFMSVKEAEKQAGNRWLLH
ncbi:penicillin amidase [Chitinophaga sp. CF118]|uniref:penicillin acylase family protein n=1 Tax=Chitinophaga sp. CF118 TaxID=1884367 RepID=UPI0008E3A0A6|nr:penicillin acylase family protein [Chitinophaga sp. CF118]SFF10287.1 penicillin amidase [Chitinophaga sp. CF118]